MANKFGAKKNGFFFVLTLLLVIFLSNFFHFASADAMLDIGPTVNSKMRALATGKSVDSWTKVNEIKAIHMASNLPKDFIPSQANTVSVANSSQPIYIFFDNHDNAGIIYFYTESDKVIMNPDSSRMFANNIALSDISGLVNWDSSKVVNMYGLFAGAESLSDISALADWNTSNVTDMYGLFTHAKSLPDALALRNWNTSNVTDMSHMFSNASSLMFIDVSNWDTSKVKTMVCMFQVGDNHEGNGQLKEINGLGDLDVSNVTDMTCMFYGAGQMTYYDVSRWNVSKVESMNHMFCDNYKLVSLDLYNWDVSSVKTMYCMFDDCQALKTIGDVSHWNTVSLIDAGGWLNWATSFVGNNEGVLDLSGWDTSNLKTVGEMFLKTRIHKIDLSGWTFDSITNDKWDGAGKGIYYEYGNGYDPVRGFRQMFSGAKNLSSVYVSQAGLDSFNAAVENGVYIDDMWTGSMADSFTVK